MALDLLHTEVKNVCMHNVSSLPTGYGAAHSGATVSLNGVLYTWSGTAWVSGGGAPVPNNVVYVSPNFPNVFPFYSTLQTAHAN